MFIVYRVYTPILLVVSARALECTLCTGSAVALSVPVACFQLPCLLIAYLKYVYRTLSALLLAKGRLATTRKRRGSCIYEMLVHYKNDACVSEKHRESCRCLADSSLQPQESNVLL